MSETINREAHEVTKGFRLQKIRAACLILDAVEKNDVISAYTAIESIEDVVLGVHDVEKFKFYVEEDKNYDKDKNFTFNSGPVVNTMVSFLDIWINGRFSDSMMFGFYSTTGIGKERSTDKIRSSGVVLPQKPVLQCLIDKNDEYDVAVVAAGELVKIEYLEQYGNRGLGHYGVVSGFTKREWEVFFEKIKWQFGEADEKELKAKALEKVKSSRFFRPDLGDREEIILKVILETIDEKQGAGDFSGRCVGAADVELAFWKCSAQERVKVEDIAWKMWDGLTAPEKRTVLQKIEAACVDYRLRKRELVARKVSLARLEEQAFLGDKSYRSLKYRIYQACESKLDSYFDKSLVCPLSEVDVDLILNDLFRHAGMAVAELKEDFRYQVKNGASIEGIVLQLFDDCFLRLDEDYRDA